MSRDYKNSPKRSRRSSGWSAGSTFTGIAIGLMLGIILALALTLYLNRSASPFMNKVQQPEPKKPPQVKKPDLAKPLESASAPSETKPAETKTAGPSASAVILGSEEADRFRFDGVGNALALGEAGAPVDVRLFGKPRTLANRRMGVTLARAASVEQARATAVAAASMIAIRIDRLEESR